jgi:hypothetical protein
VATAMPSTSSAIKGPAIGARRGAGGAAARR